MSNLSDLERRDLQRRDREARREEIYNHPSSVKRREDAKRTIGSNHIGARHADERGALQHRQHEESKKLSQEQQVEVDRHRATGRPMPADLPKKHTAARKQLTEKHAHERQQLHDRHLLQREAERKGRAK
jgi:hypothetical protein